MKRNTMQSVIITKLEVAVRQVKATVRLFFREDDPVVIHTLIAAAHQILVDLGKIDNIDSAVKNTTRMRLTEKRKFIAAVNYSFNFFKHADRDPDHRIDIASLPRFTQDFIMDAILMLQRLSGDIPPEAKVYWHWFVSKYPEEFDNLPQDGQIAKMQKLKIAEMPFEEISAMIEFNSILTGKQS